MGRGILSELGGSDHKSIAEDILENHHNEGSIDVITRISMELLLGLGSLLGLSALVQSKSVPSEAEFTKAKAKLETNPLDPDANNAVGKYMAFALGDFSGAMPYLVHSPDKVLKTLAEHELDDAHNDTPVKKVGMGDEWVLAAKKVPALSTMYYDRAGDWYAPAFPKLDGLWQAKVREQGKKLAASRPIGPARKGFPTNWVVGNAGEKFIPTVDGNIAHTGSYSIKLADKDPKANEMLFTSAPISVTGKKNLELSAYVLADGTDNPTDQIFAYGFDAGGVGIATWGSLIPTDTPVWRKIVVKKEIPANIVFIKAGATKRSQGGTLWVDDFSVKLDDKEVVKNGSFEEK